MDLTPNPDQLALEEVLGRFLRAEATPSVVRDAEPFGFSHDLWSKLGALGLVGMSVPTGGWGESAGLLSAEMVCEQVGRHLAPVPLVDTIVAARTLTRAGSPLADMLTDDGLIGSVGLTAAIDGVAIAVPAGAVADVVVARDGDHLVAVRQAPVAADRVTVLGSVPLADRPVDAAAGSEVVVLCSGADAVVLHRQAVTEWRTLTAGALVGLAEGALGLAVDYVKERRQFGVPIGSFQTVSHRLADCSISVEGARLLAREAAWAVDAAPDQADQLARMALAFAAETAQHVSAESLHFHGGYGYMLEYDVQMYYSRAKAWSLIGGNPTHLYVSVADEVIGNSTPEAPWISR